MQEADYKRCHGCDTEKPLSEFFRDSRRKDGRQTRCKSCQTLKRQEWSEDNRERQREMLREWNERNPEKVLKATAKHRSKDGGERERVRQTLRNAVAAGRVPKPGHCECCGKPGRGHEIQGHHHDYAKPLDVEWLCTLCHGKRHRKGSPT